MVTILISYKDAYEKIFNDLLDLNILFWFMHKKGKVRLRVYEDELELVKKIIEEKESTYTVIAYEPEVNIFGGENLIGKIHLLLCSIATWILEVQRNERLAECNESDLDAIYLRFINHLVSCFELDDFETWDVWCKVVSHRRIDLKKYRGIILSKMFDVYSGVYEVDRINQVESQNETVALERMEQIIKDICMIYYSEKCERGIRGIISSIIIFTFNMMKESSGKQAGFSHIMYMLNNPDIRRVIDL